MATHQELAPRGWVPSVDVSDPVDLGLQAGLGELIDQPVARCDVLSGQGRSVDASFVRADAAQFMKVVEEPIGRNLGHGSGDLWGGGAAHSGLSNAKLEMTFAMATDTL